MRVACRVSYQVLNWENCCPWTAFMDVWTTEFAVRDYISETQTANYWQLLHIVKHESCDTKLPCCWHHRDNWCREGGGGQTRGCNVSDPTIHLPLHESTTRSSSSLSPTVFTSVRVFGWILSPSSFRFILCVNDGATENASTENESTGGWNMQVRKTQVRICNGGKRKYSNLKSILKSLRFSSLAFSLQSIRWQ